MLVAFGLILLGGVLLFAGGELLVRGASAVASCAGLSPAVIGLTVVAFGTSCPELAVSLGAALDGHGDIALGNVVGSNIANIALVAALAAVIAPIQTHRDLIRIDGPVLVVITVALAGMIFFGGVPRIAGLMLLVVLVVFTVWRIRHARRDGAAEYDESTHGSLPGMLLLTVAGVVLLAFGGQFFVDGALDLARILDISEAVIGLTILALGTSLPEIATTIVAARKNASDLALGNAIGSCVYNILAVLGATASISPVTTNGITMVDSMMMLGTAILCWLLIWTGRRFSRQEGLVLLMLYAAYVVWLYLR